jgi:para-nitrobenzyl esterase
MRLRGAWIAAALCCVTVLGAHGAVVATADGPVEGLRRNGIEQFLGIPFAAPPVGPLRWMPPQEAAKWTQVRPAKSFGPPCAQVTTLGPFAGPPNSNEDCLYLNIFTPDAKAKLPVLVWIHGGGYFDGASNDYDGSKLAAQGKLVVVTINYRLNLFGFLAHPALDSEGHVFGNYGLMDMQAALKWVQANIASFGGDPKNPGRTVSRRGCGRRPCHLTGRGGIVSSRNLPERRLFAFGTPRQRPRARRKIR